MRPTICWLFAGMVAAIVLTPGAWAQDKVAIPSAAAREEAREVILELYDKELKAARTQPAQAVRLAQSMIATAAGTKDDDAARFSLLNEARTLAAAAGDLTAATQALAALEEGFDIPPPVRISVRAQTLADLARPIAPGEPSRMAAEKALALVDEAAAADEFGTARRAAEAAVALARKSKDVALVRKAAARQSDIKGQEAHFALVKSALERLTSKADDPEANLTVGRYRCFQSGDWERGLPHLAMGADAALMALAEAELAAPEDALAQAKIADGWWDWAEKLPEKDESVREQVKQHARTWYERAAPGLTGLTLLKAQSRLGESAPAADGLALAFRFERGDFLTRGGTAYVRDASGKGNDGEVIACQAARGVLGGGLRFDGQKSVVQVKQSESLAWETFTISVWAYFEEERGGEVLVSNLDNGRLNNDVFHFMRVQFKSAAGFRGIDGDGGQHYKPLAGRWTHFVAVWDGKRCVLWADGKKVSQTNEISDRPGPPSGPLTLGKNTGAFTSNFQGVLDDLAIYNRALSEREIEALYAAVPKRADGQPAADGK